MAGGSQPLPKEDNVKNVVEICFKISRANELVLLSQKITLTTDL